jgi:excinuclease ABC subunit A
MTKADQNSYIKVRNARTHNLKNVDIDIPIGKLSCIFGPSGSGKSSLAFHTLYQESKRRFINSFPTDVKFFWDIPQTVDVDKISPVLPVWALAQGNPVVGSRPVVSDLIGFMDALGKVFFKSAKPVCPDHGQYLENRYESVHQRLEEFSAHRVVHVFVSDTEYAEVYGQSSFASRSFSSEDGIRDFNSEDSLWEVFRVKGAKINEFLKKFKDSGLENKVTKVLLVPEGSNEGKWILLSKDLGCKKCDYMFSDQVASAYAFSAYNASSACSTCQGHGMVLNYDPKKLVKKPYLSINDGAINIIDYKAFRHLKPKLMAEFKKNKISLTKPFDDLPEKKWDILLHGSGGFVGALELLRYLETKRYKKNVRIYLRSMQSEYQCGDCDGLRVKQSIQHIGFLLKSQNILFKDFLSATVDEASLLLDRLTNLNQDESNSFLLSAIAEQLKIAREFGLGYLSLKRKVKTLNSCEYQKLLLIKYLGFKGEGSLFVLDEPSVGLSLSEQKMVHKYLRELVKQGNTVLLVEHSSFFHKKSDYLVEMGPGAGELGGEVVWQGPTKNYSFARTKSKKREKTKSDNFLEFKNLAIRDLELKSLRLPMNAITCASGNSGVGKNSFLLDTVGHYLYYEKYLEHLSPHPGVIEEIKGNYDFDKVIVVDTDNSRLTSRSTVGTLTGLASYVRSHFSSLEVSKALGLKEGHFNPNSQLGACATCEGKGVKVVEMNFLEDLKFTCEDCEGKKIKPTYASINDGVMNVHEAFTLPLDQVVPNIKQTPKVIKILSYMKMLNLEYLSLGRSLSSLSGGEKLRIQILSQLISKLNGSILFLKNVSYGLGEREIESLMNFFDLLKASGNTILLLDKNEKLMSYCDYQLEFVAGKNGRASSSLTP